MVPVMDQSSSHMYVYAANPSTTGLSTTVGALPDAQGVWVATCWQCAKKHRFLLHTNAGQVLHLREKQACTPSSYALLPLLGRTADFCLAQAILHTVCLAQALLHTLMPVLRIQSATSQVPRSPVIKKKWSFPPACKP